jgi:hypothetical protein
MKKEEMKIAAKKELQQLTDQINVLIKQRAEFIDENGYLFAPFYLGQKVINKETLELGFVLDYYQSGDNDGYFNIHCKMMKCDNHWNSKLIIDNTSSYYPKMPWVDFEEYKKDFENSVGKIEFKIEEEI